MVVGEVVMVVTAVVMFCTFWQHSLATQSLAKRTDCIRL